MSRADERLRNAATLLGQVEREADTQWARKTAYEGRAFAVFTLNLGIATLYLAIREQAGLAEIAVGSWSFVVLLISFAMVIVSTAAAIMVAAPRAYPALNTKALEQMALGLDKSSWSYELVFLRARIGLVEKARTQNRRKATWTIVALVAASVEIVAFVAVFVLNAVSW